jgi:hypothetical protein
VLMTRAGIRRWRQRGQGSGGGAYTWPNGLGPLDHGSGPKKCSPSPVWHSLLVPIPDLARHRARAWASIPAHSAITSTTRASIYFKLWMWMWMCILKGSGIASASLDRHISLDLFEPVTYLDVYFKNLGTSTKFKGHRCILFSGLKTCQVPPL